MSHAMRIHAIAGQVISVLAPWDPSLDDLCSVFALLLAEHCEIISHAPGLPKVDAKHYRQLATARMADRIELFAVACAESWRLGEQAKAIDPTNTGDVLPTPDTFGQYAERIAQAQDVSDLLVKTWTKPPRKPG